MTLSEFKKLTAQVFNREISQEEYCNKIKMIKKDGKWTFERKLKETPNFIPPALSEFIGFFSKEGYKTDNAENIYKGYEDAGWKDSQGKPIRNWKQKVRFVWFKPENKEKRGLLKTLN